MATLERIDRIKTDLQIAKQGLHEADNWTVLANDVEEVYSRSKEGGARRILFQVALNVAGV